MLGGISSKRRKGRAPTECDRAAAMHGPAPFRWTSIYDDWRGYWLLGGDREPGPDFLDLPVESPNDGRAVGGPALDWWPTKQIAERQRMLRQEGTAVGTRPVLGAVFLDGASKCRLPAPKQTDRISLPTDSATALPEVRFLLPRCYHSGRN